MKKRAELLSALAKAKTFDEQTQILGDLRALDAQAARQVQAERDVDWSDTVVRQTLSPVSVHEFHTASTEWLGAVDTTGDEYHNQIIAKASAWYGRTSEAVKSDPEEFAAQATGYLRREASQYGMAANAAYAAGLEYLSFLRRREGASGLPQVEQTVAPDGVTQQPTPLPPEVFDNFAPPVHPINEGVSGTETSERNPLLQEIVGEGNGGQQETLHSTAPVTTQPETRMAALDAPSLAIGHVMNLDQFKAMQRAAKDVTDGTDYPDPSEARTLEELGYVSPLGVGNVDVVAAPGAGDSGSERLIQNATRKQAADGDSQGVDDGRYDSTGGSDDEGGSAAIDRLMDVTGMSEQEIRQRYPNPQAALALLDAAQTKQSARHTAAQVIYHEQYGDVTRPQLAAYRKHNVPPAMHDALVDRFGEGAHDQITKWVKNKAAQNGGRIDYHDVWDDDAHYASRKEAASGLDQIQQTVAPDGVTPRPTPLPADVAFPLVDETEMDSSQLLDGDPRAAVEKAAALDDTDGDDCRSCGERVFGSGAGIPVGVDGVPPSEIKRACPNCGVMNYRQRKASKSFVPKDAMAHPEFFKGYGFGRNWRPGQRLAAKGSPEFEAGLYAGITDNHEHQGSWLVAHARQAPEFAYLDKRIEQHDTLTRRLSARTGARTAGIYVEANPAALLAPLVRAVAPAVVSGVADAVTGGSEEEKTAARRAAKDGTCPECLGHGNVHGKECEACDGTGKESWARFSTKRVATTETDLNTMAPGTSPSPVGDTPINGPGRPGPLAGYSEPAAPGGPAPYNGAEPMGKPVVPGAVIPPSVDTASMVSHSTPPNPFASQQTVAFRRRVQAGLLRLGGKR